MDQGEEMGLKLTFGHVLAIMAFLHFRENDVEVAVIECSVGGTSSSTNFIDADVAVITSIGLDHCHLLGDTREEICRDKSGII